MAYVAGSFFVNIAFVDSGLNTSRKRVQLQAADMTEALASAAAIVPKFAAISACYVVNYTVEQEFNNDAAGYPPTADAAEVSTRALLTVGLTTIPKKASLEVPGPIDGIFGAAGTSDFNKVDVSNAAVKALVNAFNTGQDGYISDGENTLNTSAGGLVGGRRIHRGSNG